MNRCFSILRGMFICFFVPCCVFLLSSCGGDADYSPLLVQADSAIVGGDYIKADSLLAEYDSQQASDEETEQMYRELLRLTRKYVDDQLNVADISAVDSLFRFYEDSDALDKRVKSLLFLADVYKKSGDYPSALNYSLQAKNLAYEYDNTVLLCWVNQDIGGLYFAQRMLGECLEYYRKYYHIAESRHDTLRISYAAARMGLVHTINSNVDSIIYYYNKAITYGQHYPSAKQTVEKSRHNLCDIYIQIEEFDKALALMPRDIENLDNWAYWHWGQNHVDSAAHYFQKLLLLNPSKRIGTKSEYLRILLQIEKQRGNVKKALAYYENLIAVEDSMKVLSQTEEMRKVDAQYNFNAIKQERDKIAERHQTMRMALLLIFLVINILFVTAINIWNSYKRRKERELTYEKVLRQRKEAQYRQSQDQIRENLVRIEQLAQQLDEARQQNDKERAGKLELEAEMLTVHNKDIETTLRRKEYIRQEFETSDLYMHLKMHDGDVYRLSDADWKQLGTYMDDIYDHFTSRLLSLANLSQTELRVCYLVKMGLPPVHVASLLCVTTSAVSKTRSRLFQKLTGQKGSSSQFDELIQRL